MGPRCKRCKDGAIVTFTGRGRLDATCTCERGVALAERRLRDALLATFHATKIQP